MSSDDLDLEETGELLKQRLVAMGARLEQMAAELHRLAAQLREGGTEDA